MQKSTVQKIKNSIIISLFVLLLLASFILINTTSGALFSGNRADLTSDRLNTLSLRSEEIIAGINKPVYVKLYLSSQISRQNPVLAQYAQNIIRLLGRYQDKSNHLIKIEILDPEPYSNVENEAKTAGLVPLPDSENEKLYFGAVFSDDKGRSYTIPQFSPQRLNYLENDLSRAVSNILMPKRKVIGIASDLPLINPGFMNAEKQKNWTFVNLLNKDYAIVPISTTTAEIPNIDVLIIVATGKLPSLFIYALDQYILRGGRLLLIIDPASEIKKRLYLGIPDENLNLNALLDNLGIHYVPDQVLGDREQAVDAFFAATEIAVLSLNENKVRKQSEEGNKQATKLLKIIEQPTTFLSTIQVGITLAGFLGSAFAADNFASLLTNWLVNTVGFHSISASALNTISVIVITLILSYFTLVLGELVPKRIAMQKPDAVIKISLNVVRFLSVVLRPITWFLSVSTNGVLRLLGIDPNKEAEEVSEEEIRMMVDIGEENGSIETGEKEMIENIFEFNNNTAEDVMIHRTDMEIIWLEDSPEQILARIEETGLSRFPVCDEDVDDVVGILATREYLLNRQLANPKPLKELLRAPYFVPESIHADILFRKMQEMKCHMAIVVDEYGGTSGLITMEDLLECIVGNIYDEFDPQEEQDITKLGDNLWRVSGSADLEEIAKTLDITLPEEEEYDTLGGMILDHLNAIPEDGSTFSLDLAGMHIDVLNIADRRIEWTNVSLLPKADPAPAEEEE